jgi:hypothetical protein
MLSLTSPPPFIEGWEGSFTKPLSAQFSWLNQGNALVSDDPHGMAMQIPGAGASSGYSIASLLQAVPAGEPWTLYARLQIFLPTPGTSARAGIALYESASGKYAMFQLSNSQTVACISMASATATPAALGTPFENFVGQLTNVWMSANDDGTNYNFKFSSDGLSWIGTFQFAKTAAFTTKASHIGIGMLLNSAAIALPVWAKLLSFGFSPPQPRM